MTIFFFSLQSGGFGDSGTLVSAGSFSFGCTTCGKKHVPLLGWLARAPSEDSAELKLVVQDWTGQLDREMLNRVSRWRSEGNSVKVLYGKRPPSTQDVNTFVNAGFETTQVPHLEGKFATVGRNRVMFAGFPWWGNEQRGSTIARWNFGIWLEGDNVLAAIRD